jgi:hypothetical protein
MHLSKGVLIHDMKVCKPKAVGRGICYECHAPKLLCFKGTLKEGAWRLLENNKLILKFITTFA